MYKNNHRFYIIVFIIPFYPYFVNNLRVGEMTENFVQNDIR